MALGSVIKSILVADVPFIAKVPASKIYAVNVTQAETFPAVVFQLSNMTPTDIKGQVSKKDIYIYDIYSVSQDYDEAHEIDNLVRDALDGADGTYDGKIIDGIRLEATTELYDIDIVDAYLVKSTYRIRHTL